MSDKTQILTDLEELFCQEYLIDLNKTQAYIRAYNSENYNSARTEASKTFAKPNIYARIKELMNERANRMEISQDWVILNLQQVYERCMQVEPVLKWDYEEKALVETGLYQFDSTGANKSMELIGKHLGMFVSKQEKQNTVDVTGLSPEQFRELLSRINANTPSGTSE